MRQKEALFELFIARIMCAKAMGKKTNAMAFEELKSGKVGLLSFLFQIPHLKIFIE